MNEQNYINHYVEILTSTMTEAVIRNVSLQAQTKVINEVVENQSKQLDDLNNTINNLKDEINSLKNQNSDFNNMKNIGDNGLNFNLCSPACCSDQYSLPFKMPADKMTCNSKKDFVPTSYMCNRPRLARKPAQRIVCRLRACSAC